MANYIWPLSNSTTPDEMNTSFGPRINKNRWDFHDGIDLPSDEGITPVYAMRDGKVHRVPSYRNVFALKPVSWGLRVDIAFTPGFDRALEGMIVPSNNAAATTCLYGAGYGHLNGALAAGGFFDPSSNQGLWVGAEFQGGKKCPNLRIVSRNDGFVAQAGTTRDMAKLVSFRLLDPVNCQDHQSHDHGVPKLDWSASLALTELEE